MALEPVCQQELMKRNLGLAKHNLEVVQHLLTSILWSVSGYVQSLDQSGLSNLAEMAYLLMMLNSVSLFSKRRVCYLCRGKSALERCLRAMFDWALGKVLRIWKLPWRRWLLSLARIMRWCPWLS